MYTAIYRDFRPDNFDQLVGQDHIVKILKNQIASGSTGHAYLFCGTRGTGKTTSARILAKALNCESEGERPCGVCENCLAIKEGSFMDVIEIDAASNNGVDSIRELRESVKYPPVKGRNKVYIIDEVHMLSTGAFNALLKTLEEPPEHVVFILATTEPQKLPATILSRCMRLDFRRVSEKVIIDNMKMICDARGLTAEDSALALIAVNADGSVRDSLSILEQCISTGSDTITRDDVAEMLGTAGEEIMIAITEHVMNADIAKALLLLDSAINSGRDVKQFMKEWLAHFRNLLMAKYIDHPENTLNMSLENAQRVQAQSQDISTDLLNRAITELTKTISESRWSAQPRVMLEMCIVRLGAGQEVEKTVIFQADGRAAAVMQQAAGNVPMSESTANSGPNAPSGAAQPSQDASGNGEMPFVDYSAPVSQDAPPSMFDALEKAEPSSGSPELDSLWADVVKKSVGEKPMLIRIETKTRLTRVDDKNFFVKAEDEITEKMLMEKGKNIIEQKFEMFYGQSRALCIDGKRGADSAQNTQDDEAKLIAEKINQRFGVDVEIK